MLAIYFNHLSISFENMRKGSLREIYLHFNVNVFKLVKLLHNLST